MAILINSPSAVKPAIFVQSKDPVYFKLLSSAAHPGVGSKANLRLTFTGGVSNLNYIILSTPLFGTNAFVFLNVPFDSGWALPSYVSGSTASYILLVAAALRTNPFIANHYIVTTTSTYIDITAIEVGDLYRFYGVSDSSSNLTSLVTITGSDAYFAPNFRLRFSLFCQKPLDPTAKLVNESYSAPDADAYNRHNIHEFLHNVLAFDLGPFTTGILSDRSAKWFVHINENYGTPPEHWQIITYSGGADGTFVYRGGSARLNTGVFSSLVSSKQILKPYGRGSQTASAGFMGKYFASYVNLAKVLMQVMVTYELEDGTISFFELSSYSLPKFGAIYSTECSPYLIAQLLSASYGFTIEAESIVNYELVTVFDGIPGLSSYTFKPVAEEYGQQVFWFESSMGVTETCVATGDNELGIEVSKDDFRIMFPDHGATTASREAYQRVNYYMFKGEAFSGFKPLADLMDFWIDLLISENVWTHDEHGDLFRIHIDPDSYSLARKDDALYGVKFSYKRTMYHQAYSTQ